MRSKGIQSGNTLMRLLLDNSSKKLPMHATRVYVCTVETHCPCLFMFAESYVVSPLRMKGTDNGLCGVGIGGRMAAKKQLNMVQYEIEGHPKCSCLRSPKWRQSDGMQKHPQVLVLLRHSWLNEFKETKQETVA